MILASYSIAIYTLPVRLLVWYYTLSTVMLFRFVLFSFTGRVQKNILYKQLCMHCYVGLLTSMHDFIQTHQLVCSIHVIHILEWQLVESLPYIFQYSSHVVQEIDGCLIGTWHFQNLRWPSNFFHSLFQTMRTQFLFPNLGESFDSQSIQF